MLAYHECPTIETVGIELEGGWVCTCPIRVNQDEYGIKYDPLTGRLEATGIMRHHRRPHEKYLMANPEHGVTLHPKIGALLFAKDKIKKCKCIPKFIRHDGTVNVGVIDAQKGEVCPVNRNGDPIGLAIADWPKWVQDHYPPLVNLTCGLHVHMRFKDHDRTYDKIMRPGIEKHLVNDLVKWAQAMKVPLIHPLWHRLVGGSLHCRLGITSDIIRQQYYNVEKEGASRYYAVNFCKARHNTLEIRILPMFKDVNTALRAVNCVLGSVDKFVQWALTQPLPSIETMITLDDMEKMIPNRELANVQCNIVEREMIEEYELDRQELAYQY